MTTMTATEVSRNFSRVLDSVEHGEEEIGIVRNKHPVARIVPEAKAMTAVEALGDLYSTLPAEEGAAWMNDIEDMRQWMVAEPRVDPWA
ncbi:MAG: type II toxin-antitoxin system prevent-host-death family antitoxin [Kiritimatiellaeota bacterium]|nr:type II toxin-antitoxin system prevent-host-death family antitoxin [Kiritimatiellota bacterium]